MASNETHYRTAGGAVLILTTVAPDAKGWPRAEWTCNGCGAIATPTADPSARDRANKHANRCRVMHRN